MLILEQLKNSLPSRVATYLNKGKVTTVTKGAVVADEFVLIHKNRSSEPVHEPVVQGDTSKESPTCFSGSSGQVGQGTS